MPRFDGADTAPDSQPGVAWPCALICAGLHAKNVSWQSAVFGFCYSSTTFIQRFLKMVEPSHLRAALMAAVCLFVAGCVQPVRNSVVVCDPYCSERSTDQVNQDLNEVPDDGGKAAALEKMAENNPRAAYDLGLRYFRGDGVPRDSYKALTWMRAAADRGELRAQKALGVFYLTGLEEMGPDPREAQTWLSLAASRPAIRIKTLR
jgi:hypothetical protein